MQRHASVLLHPESLTIYSFITIHSGALSANLDEIASINRDCLTVEILAASTEEYGSGHIPIIARPSSRETFLLLLGHLTLLRLIAALLRRHLRREHTRRDGVDADLETRFGDLGGQHLVQVYCGGLRCVVGEVALADADEPGD